MLYLQLSCKFEIFFKGKKIFLKEKTHMLMSLWDSSLSLAYTQDHLSNFEVKIFIWMANSFQS